MTRLLARHRRVVAQRNLLRRMLRLTTRELRVCQRQLVQAREECQRQRALAEHYERAWRSEHNANLDNRVIRPARAWGRS